MIAVACGYIFEDISDIDLQNNITVTGLGYGKPSLEGESVNFSCSCLLDQIQQHVWGTEMGTRSQGSGM